MRYASVIAFLLAAACAGPGQPTPTAPASPSPAATTSLPVATATPDAPTEVPSSPTLGPTAGPRETASPTPSPPGGAWPPPPIAFEVVADGLDNLTFLTHADSGQVYVVEQRGVIRVGPKPDVLVPEPFLDLTDRVRAGGERGLLGLAFHPDYKDNGRLFVNYTDRSGDTVISEFALIEGCACADPESEQVLLTIEQPFGNHNGGMIAFGPDGYFYIATGDGGSAGDPQGNGQDLTALLGKLLRIDVDGEEPYAIPPDNPFVGAGDEARPEIWAYGLRNPWRFSFDRQTGDLFIGDVGQNRWEEIDVEPAAEGGRNYGWNVMEGPECFAQADCDAGGLVGPVAWYETGRGCAVTGGYVYRGRAIPDLVGTYLYADYCSGDVWALEAAAALAVSQPPVEVVEMGNAGINVTSFGEDEAGELYLVGAGGEVLRVFAGD